MPTTVHRTLKIKAFKANDPGSQAYKVRKQLQDLKIDMVLFSETLKIHMKYCIPNYDIYWTDCEDSTKAELPSQLRKASLTHMLTNHLSYQ